MAEDKRKPGNFPTIVIDMPQLPAHEEEVTLEKWMFCWKVCSAYRGAKFLGDTITIKCFRIVGLCLYDHPLVKK